MTDNTIVMHKLGVLKVEPLPDTGRAPLDITVIAQQVLRAFYREVCERAEKNMELTGTVSGAHWNAMRAVLADMGVEVER